MLSVLFALSSVTILHAQFNDYIEQIFCNSIIKGSFPPGQNQEYLLMIEDNSNVNFDACLSVSDIIIALLDDEDTNVVWDYCFWGDSCGECEIQNNPHPENFTIPHLEEGMYLLRIMPWTYNLPEPILYHLNISCIKTGEAIPTTPSPTISDIPLKCGDTITRELLTMYDISYFYLWIEESTDYLLIDSCLSSYRSAVYLLDNNWTQLYEGEYDYDCQYFAQKLQISGMIESGLYILEISGWPGFAAHQFGKYHVSIVCESIPILPVINASYILHNGVLQPADAEVVCENTYRTTLATIVTEEDKEEARQILVYNKLVLSDSIDGVFIGGFHEMTTNSNWKWMDGTLWDNISLSGQNDTVQISNKFQYPMITILSAPYDLYNAHSLHIFTHNVSYSTFRPFLCNRMYTQLLSFVDYVTFQISY